MIAAPRVSVLIPTYDYAAFISRALDSLLAQQEQRWQALIIDDGSTDATDAVVRPYLADPRLSYLRLQENRGLAAALNVGLCRTDAPYVAYLPSDDVYYPEHLARLLERIEAEPETVLVYSGLRHDYDRVSQGLVPGYPLQLVQTLHRRTDDRWVEREELVTDDLERLFWGRLRRHGAFAGTGSVSCEWVFHRRQMHRWMRESSGGVNPFRLRYQVRHPMRYHSSEGELIDEVARYERFRTWPPPVRRSDSLTILLVGELAYNPERILALEERGHRLYGLWTDEGWWFNSVGPLPFGHVEELPRADWQAALRRIKPDIIYALLNWQAVPFAQRVLRESTGVPFVWHLKEGPFACLEHGIWQELVDLLTRSDGQIYTSEEMREWFAHVLPGGVERERTLILDGDLPKREWFTDARQPRLSGADGEIHTVAPGRPVGMTPTFVGELARAGIHLHCYGRYSGFVGSYGSGQWERWAQEAMRLAPRHLHLHESVPQERWVEEFSRYDAGWLHVFRSVNGGDPRRANWDDMNLPARMTTLIAAGVPLLQADNRGHVVAMEALARRRGIGVSFRDVDDLRRQLRDGAALAAAQDAVWRQRLQFSFDTHADRLLDFFRAVIARASPRT